MSLKSSEIKNFLSWWISTILKSFLVASASCHLVLPYIVRPILRMLSNLFRRSSSNLQNSIAPSSSRGNSPCRRRVFINFASGCARFDWALGSISIHFLSRMGIVLEDEQEVEGLLGFASALDRLAIANTSVFVVEVSCSMSSYFLMIKSVTNLFRSWEILIPLRVYLVSNWLWLPIRVQFWCSLESNLSGQLICHLVVKHSHDMSLALLRLQLISGILHQYKLLSIDLVVKGFLCASAIDFLVQESQSKV